MEEGKAIFYTVVLVLGIYGAARLISVAFFKSKEEYERRKNRGTKPHA
jgi:hypothetical protein